MDSYEIVKLRDRIGLLQFRPEILHETLQRLTWIMSDPSILNQAIDDAEEMNTNVRT